MPGTPSSRHIEFRWLVGGDDSSYTTGVELVVDGGLTQF
jgi:hypothetical protein